MIGIIIVIIIICVFIMICLFLTAVIWQVSLLIRKILIDIFMKRQGYVLVSYRGINVWFYKDEWVTAQRLLYNKSFKDIKTEYTKSIYNK
nr:MAG TPA: hypothetical protein [Caudoviricetes sp.]